MSANPTDCTSSDSGSMNHHAASAASPSSANDHTQSSLKRKRSEDDEHAATEPGFIPANSKGEVCPQSQQPLPSIHGLKMGEKSFTSSGSGKRVRKSKMHEDLEEMMYGFGDAWPPNPESVQVVENIAVRYIQDLAARAKQVAEVRGNKLDKDCFLYIIRKDRPKFARACQLLKTNEELKSVQRLELKEQAEQQE